MAPSTPGPVGKHDAEAAAWLYAHSGDGFALLENGRIVSVNPAWCRILGFDARDSVGQHALKTIHPDDRPLYIAAANELAERGEANLEHRALTSDGRLIWVRLAVKTTEDGLHMVVMKDITAEHNQRLEADLANKTGKMLRTAARVYTWRFNPETGRYFSDRDPGVTGSTQQEVTSEEMTAEIHPDDRADMGRAFNKTLRTGEPQQCHYRHARHDGAWSRYRSTWQGGRLCSNGQYEVLGLTQDITELAEARDAALSGEKLARDAAEVKARFLANMSHEIRTPLNGVLGVLHLLKKETLSLEGQAMVEQALGCGDMLTQLLNDVLDFSKIEAGKLELHPEPLDPCSTLEGVADMLRPQAAARGLHLQTRFVGPPHWVSVDPVRLRQVLFNLIGNAVKFTLKGGVDICMTALGSGADHRLQVEVQDTGVGVAPEAMDVLFERFHQVDGSTTRRFGGTGLGLAITRSLVEQMGGEVTATSVIGEGSRFAFEISAPEVERPVREETDDVAWLEGLRILVVEDNPTNRLIASRMLQSLGAIVDTADNGARGVQATQIQAFDLIFMDIQMPVMDGVEATRRIRALQGAAARTPIVAMTANVFSHQIREYLAAGMDGAVAKPLNPAEILTELARLSRQDDPAAVA